MSKDDEDCNCVQCYLEKRTAFEAGKKVNIQGYEILAFYDASIVSDEGERRAALGLRSTARIKDLLMIAEAYISAAGEMIGEEVILPEVKHEDRN